MKMELKPQVEPCPAVWNSGASRTFTRISLGTAISASVGLAVGSLMDSQTLMSISMSILVLAFCMILSTLICIHTRNSDFPGCFAVDCQKDHNRGTLKAHKDSLVKLFTALALIIPVNFAVVAVMADEESLSQIVSSDESDQNPSTEKNDPVEKDNAPEKDAQSASDKELYDEKKEIKEKVNSLGYR